MTNVEPLETWTVGTFNVVSFGLVLVLFGHMSGALTNILPAIGTLPGVLLFAYLWALVVLATRWALAGGGLVRVHTEGLRALVVRGTLAGAFIGLAFVLGIVVVGGLANLLTGGGALRPLGLIALLGGSIGAIIGAAVGIVFVLVDVILYWIITRLLSVPAE